MSKKALITGGAGALGSTLTKMLLKKRWNVIIYDIVQRNRAWRLADVLHEVKYHWQSCHDMQRRAFEDVNIVIHAAAQPDRPLGLTSPLYTLEMNVMALARVLEACRHTNIEKFIFPGSGTTFTGVPEEELPVTEESIPKPSNPYSASKYMAEVLCHTYRRCYEIPTVMLRSGLVYGAGMRLDISVAQFIIKALTDVPIVVRSPRATRTPTHIDDVMKYWEAVIDAEPEKVVGNIFHSVLGKEYTIENIARTVVKVLGKGVVLPGEFEAGEMINGKPVREWTTSTKDDLLGVKPNIQLEEGIKRTLPYIKEFLAV